MDAQSFSNSFEGVLGVVRKSGRGSSIFFVLLNFYDQIFQSLLKGEHKLPPSSPPPGPPPPVCIYDSLSKFLLVKGATLKLRNERAF
jgi:hypothetical protein